MQDRTSQNKRKQKDKPEQNLNILTDDDSIIADSLRKDVLANPKDAIAETKNERITIMASL